MVGDGTSYPNCPMLSNTTRARLEDLVNGNAPYTLGDYRLDVRAALAALDAARPIVQAAARMAGLRATYLAIMNGDITPAAPAVEQYTRDAETTWDALVAAVRGAAGEGRDDR